jgi:PPK2 family polyphosphate:nucleotide phosphotransferase
VYVKAIKRAGKRTRLDRISTKPPDSLSRKDATKRFRAIGQELFDLQDLMYGSRGNGVLVVLQGRDTAGKDGTIKHVVGSLNPRGVSIASFGVPTEEELEHDFLWRVHRHTPRLGEFSIFNRSHYEDVLVVRVHDLVPQAQWEERFELINAFERQLAHAGTIVLKFFLHISLDEQEKRLMAREREPAKSWKVNVADWRERAHWNEYTEAYEDVFARCTQPEAPWFIVPADKKWFRNLVVAEALCERLRPFRSRWWRKLDKEGQRRRAEVRAFRQRDAG